jgi:pimeloyl-ACP methyl ester carboxylesterase
MARIRDYMGFEPRFRDIPALEAHLRAVHAPFGKLSDAEWRHLAETSARPAQDGVALHYDPAIAAPIRAQEAQALDMQALWEKVRVPVLLIRGAQSDLLLPETAAAMAAEPHVTLAEIAGAGHAPALMEPGQIALVAEFLAQ